jgi:hypothetical protein
MLTRGNLRCPRGCVMTRLRHCTHTELANSLHHNVVYLQVLAPAASSNNTYGVMYKLTSFFPWNLPAILYPTIYFWWCRHRFLFAYTCIQHLIQSNLRCYQRALDQSLLLVPHSLPLQVVHQPALYLQRTPTLHSPQLLGQQSRDGWMGCANAMKMRVPHPYVDLLKVSAECPICRQLGATVLIVALCVASLFLEGRWVVSQEKVRKCQKRILRGTKSHTIIAGR